MPVCCSQSISIRFEYLSVSSSVAVRVQYVLDLRCGLSKLHSTIMVSVFPCLSLPRPPRHDERGAKLKYSLNTFIRHNKLHQLLSSRTELFCSTNNYILFPFGPRSQWSEGPETLSRQKLILHLGQPVWRSVCLLLIILSGIVPLTPNYTITYWQGLI